MNTTRHHTHRITLPALAAAFIFALGLASEPATAAGISAAGKTMTPTTSVTPSLAANAPVFTLQPKTQTYNSGDGFTPNSGVLLTVTATAPTPITFQWQVSAGEGKPWTNVTATPSTASYSPIYTIANGVNASQLTITNLHWPMDGALYHCLATSTGTTIGSVTYKLVTTPSADAKITVSAPPTPLILVHPKDKTIDAAGGVDHGVYISITATSSLPITYQWQSSPGPNQAWSNITPPTPKTPATTPIYDYGQSYNALTIANIPASMNGYLFHCIAKTNAGSTTSNPAKLTVTNPITAVTAKLADTNPVLVKLSNGSYVWRYTFTGAITLNTRSSITYQWTHANLGSTGVAQPAKTLNADKPGTYTLENDTWDIPPSLPSNILYSSRLIILTPSHPPVEVNFQQPPLPAPVQLVSDLPWPYGYVGNDVSFHVVAAGNPAPTYQWKFYGTNDVLRGVINNNTHYSDADKGTLKIHSLTEADAGLYQCTITNPLNTVTTNKIELKIVAARPGTGGGGGVTSASGTMQVPTSPGSSTSPYGGQLGVIGVWVGGPTGSPPLPATITPATAMVNTVKNLSSYTIKLSTVKADTTQSPTSYTRANTVTLGAGQTTSSFSGKTFDSIRSWVVDAPPNTTTPPQLEVTWRK